MKTYQELISEISFLGKKTPRLKDSGTVNGKPFIHHMYKNDEWNIVQNAKRLKKQNPSLSRSEISAIHFHYQQHHGGAAKSTERVTADNGKDSVEHKVVSNKTEYMKD